MLLLPVPAGGLRTPGANLARDANCAGAANRVIRGRPLSLARVMVACAVVTPMPGISSNRVTPWRKGGDLLIDPGLPVAIDVPRDRASRVEARLGTSPVVDDSEEAIRQRRPDGAAAGAVNPGPKPPSIFVGTVSAH